ncbi:hypothetical protein [Methylobacterium oryzisoli]|uniref:hypothetical protein n=1 Tax=Methylobacterium oryzisoli TaxID=3385502 RepID=UPI00389266D1
MTNHTDVDLIEASIAIGEMLSADEHVEMTQLNQECRDTHVRLSMVEEIECELVAVLGKRAKHDKELRYILDLVDTTARALRDELEATNEAIGEIIKRVIDRALDMQSVQNP